MGYNKIKTLTGLKRDLKALRARKKKIVFTNGCFDILHPGHVDYLAKAKSLGDVLVVGLNSDSSVRRLKGNARPIMSQDSRAKVLSGLESVDFIVIFSEPIPIKLIKAVSPDVLVKGGDWAVKDIVGADFVQREGGKVKSLPYLNGHSTKAVIKKILLNCQAGR
ncbi:MAG: D-glycero-beta-D-manno-heptose 1-phosphate adenylyltransferase [Candidatus Omnitrophica bacterium]|nr:D-glycero-beta-D-manno-heptose 1-phosphate adenylyltransferase [Candidatus Omnitrophota bacterium]MBU1932750.1 D-glycero-beta-D-manno-heptose 1-phosphate adenylyltransferase [Candidatus Omnitrophota bacterium]